ncbi:import inner membrane translocase subunit Tim44 [Methylocella silvestris BL2]|uniref:Import inner membrane translocase subunit Tim44 n=1 Tax=Methylocella silvestris (strain DSM 15510 / CIP 108128 / LMG 27833 / NCIMB 13906 / BL2) TaxID=395965 RepID=B8ET03_METSB|nr:Tim44 domain-containing protein [Methylocella silvestris]ACK51141.1 import inner membrane translocase subunit Tim44 [Methylocella silvestris BL2]
MAIRHKTLVMILALALAAGFSADAFARAGSGGSFGSRGSRTFSAPPSTSTAPRGASPFERSMTPNQGMFRPNSGAAGASRGGLFSGFGGGLLGGLLGAGLIGMLFGHGFGGGLGGGMSFIGLLLQLALLFFVVRFAMNYFRNRRPAMQGAGYGGAPGAGPFGSNRDNQGYGRPQQGYGAGPFAGAAPGGRQSPLQIQPADFSAFEQRLFAVQKAYSDEDMNALRALSTPEMASYFAEELGENARKGVVNKLSKVEFLQGDLAEAWSEANGDYASVAMRFSMIDQTLDRATGRLVAGDPSAPQQATEIWTFTRRSGGGAQDWKLSGIQQA